MSSQTIELLKHMWLAIMALMTHAFIGVVAITISYGLERYIFWLHDGHDALLFGRLPLRYVLEGGDAFLLICIMVFGTVAAVSTFRRHG